MNLKRVFGATVKNRPAPTVAFTYSNGRLAFNKSTAELLHFSGGESLVFFRDEDEPGSWYFAKEKGTGSVQLKTNGNALYAYSSKITRSFMKEQGEYDTATFLVSETPVDGKYYRVLGKVEN